MNSSGSQKAIAKPDAEESAVAKLAEEMKSLPSRVAERLAEVGDPLRRRRSRRFHPMMVEEIMHMPGEPGDPVGILMAASLVREDIPWLYELSMEVYRAVKNGDVENIESEMRRLRRFTEFASHGPFSEDLGKESQMLLMEFPRMLERSLVRALDFQRAQPRSRRQINKPEKYSSSSDQEPDVTEL